MKFYLSVFFLFINTSFAAGVPISESIRRNTDETYTIINPKLSRGGKVYSLSSTDGTCALFGYGLSRKGSDRFIENTTGEKVISLNSDGSFYNMRNYSILEVVTCHKKKVDRPSDLARSERIIKNADRTYTIFNPRYSHGGRLLSLTSKHGTCALFGFKNYLAASAEYDEYAPGRNVVALLDNGSFLRIGDYYVLTEISCFN